MSEGKINFYQCDDTSGNKPHYRGYVEIDGVVHELAVWPAKNGKGFSGQYRPKGERGAVNAQAASPQAATPVSDVVDDDLIPF